MNRRELLRLIGMGVVGHTLDVDRLLWVPGAKKIFIPKPSDLFKYALSDIIELELKRIIPGVRLLFERDDMFYRQFK